MWDKQIYDDGRYKIVETENYYRLYYWGTYGWTRVRQEYERNILSLVKIFKYMGKLK